jgi:DNA-binding MarR family transcriptional regulator
VFLQTFGPGTTAQPLIGALLRLPWEVVRQRILDGLHAAGFGDLTASHVSLFLYPGPNGRRPTDLADQHQMSRQAVNYLVGQVEQLGYLERRGDPGDRRSKRIALTPRGLEAGQVIRDTVVELEREWARQMGAQRFADLKRLLTELGEISAGSAPAGPQRS